VTFYLQIGGNRVRIAEDEICAAIPEIQIINALGQPSGQGGLFKIRYDNEGFFKALKIFFPSQDPKRIIAEFTAHQRIDDPAFVKMYECATILLQGHSCMYIVMEYIDGNSLQDRCFQNNQFSDEETLAFLKKLGHALDLIWTNHRIVHRDIKPANIMYKSSDDRYMLIDLAYARHLLLPSMTMPGMYPGTTGYRSPEQEAGQRMLTVKSDIFSLGVTAYQLRSNFHPGKFFPTYRWIHSVSPLTAIVPTINQDLSDIIMRMIDRIPVRRPSPRELMNL